MQLLDGKKTLTAPILNSWNMYKKKTRIQTQRLDSIGRLSFIYF